MTHIVWTRHVSDVQRCLERRPLTFFSCRNLLITLLCFHTIWNAHLNWWFHLSTFSPCKQRFCLQRSESQCADKMKSRSASKKMGHLQIILWSPIWTWLHVWSGLEQLIWTGMVGADTSLSPPSCVPATLRHHQHHTAPHHKKVHNSPRPALRPPAG